MSRPVFECIRCNDCCQGAGGIFLEIAQASGAAAELGINRKDFTVRYCRERGGRLEIICNQEGQCALLGPDGCRIHANKPEICRRWPFFQALLKDPGAFEEAKLACRGIRPDASHAEFAAAAPKESHKNRRSLK